MKLYFFAMLFCLLVVIVLEVVELTKDNTCKVESDGDDAIENMMRDPDTLVIGTDGGWPPYCDQEVVDDGTGTSYINPTGFINDFLKEACKRGNLKCEFPLIGKWHQCWGGGAAPEGQPRNLFEENAGVGIFTGMYDMCTCWVMTPQRMARVQFADNKEHGYTKRTLAGLLTLKSKMEDAEEWDRLKMMWPSDVDECVEAEMKQLPNGDWMQDCSKEVPETADDCATPCPGGKVKIGWVPGWAMDKSTFDWAINQWTSAPFGQDRVIWVDEHTHEGKTVTHADFDHLARALEKGEIDMAYTFADNILTMEGETCNTCEDPNIWNGGLTFHQTDITFAAGGVGTFARYGQSKLGERLNVGVDKLIEDKEWYCPKCMEYWPTYKDCKNTCIGCGLDAPEGGINYCAQLLTDN